MKEIAWIDDSCVDLTSCWSGPDDQSMTESLSDWVIRIWLSHWVTPSHWVIDRPWVQPHYVTIATSCHQLSLLGPVWRTQSNAGKWRRNRDKGQIDKIFGHPVGPPYEWYPFDMQQESNALHIIYARDKWLQNESGIFCCQVWLVWALVWRMVIQSDSGVE